jgi:hypothetical protein
LVRLARLKLGAAALHLAGGARDVGATVKTRVAVRSRRARRCVRPTVLVVVAALEGGAVASVVARLAHRLSTLPFGRIAERRARAGRSDVPLHRIGAALKRRADALTLAGRAHAAFRSSADPEIVAQNLRAPHAEGEDDHGPNARFHQN